MKRMWLKRFVQRKGFIVVYSSGEASIYSLSYAKSIIRTFLDDLSIKKTKQKKNTTNMCAIVPILMYFVLSFGSFKAKFVYYSEQLKIFP